MKMNALSHFLSKTIYSKNKLLDHHIYSLAKFLLFSQLIVPRYSSKCVYCWLKNTFIPN